MVHHHFLPIQVIQVANLGYPGFPDFHAHFQHSCWRCNNQGLFQNQAPTLFGNTFSCLETPAILLGSTGLLHNETFGVIEEHARQSLKNWRKGPALVNQQHFLLGQCSMGWKQPCTTVYTGPISTLVCTKDASGWGNEVSVWGFMGWWKREE